MGRIGKGIFPWIGGKSTYAGKIVQRLPESECYVEAFGGGAGVLWNKPEQYHEVYNDVDDDLVHFMETLRTRGDELRDALREVPFSRRLHEEWAEEFYVEGVRPEDPVERAVRFFYLRFSQFAGEHGSKAGFRTGRHKSSAQGFTTAVGKLDEFRDRLRGVTVENLDYADLLDRYDGPDTLFYLDPPYYDLDHYQGEEFDHERLARTVEDVTGYVALSYEDLPPWFRGDLPAGWTMETFEVPYRNSNEDDEAKRAREKLIMNYDPSEVPTLDGGLQVALDDY